MMLEFTTEVVTRIFVDDDAGSAEVSNDITCSVPLTIQAKNDIGALCTAHIIAEMQGSIDDNGSDGSV